jgi:hypothetical protein
MKSNLNSCTICRTHPAEDMPEGYQPAKGSYRIRYVLTEDELIHRLCAFHLDEARANAQLPPDSVFRYISSIQPERGVEQPPATRRS